MSTGTADGVAVKTIMTVCASREPVGYHSSGEWFGIHLGLDARAGGGWRENFLTWLKCDWKWFAYREQDGAAKAVLVTPRDSPLQDAAYPGTDGDRQCSAEAMADWLEGRVVQDAGPPTDSEGSVIEADAARRIHLQQAAAGWDAPVPHWAGLTRLVNANASLANVRIYLLPLPADVDASVNPPDTIDLSEGVGVVTIGDLQVQLYGADPLNPDLKKLPARSDSPYLRLPKEPAASRRFAEALDGHAAMLLSAHGLFLDLVVLDLVEHDGFEQLHPPGVSLALDPLRIALLSATILGKDKQLAARDGCLLAELFRLYEEEMTRGVMLTAGKRKEIQARLDIQRQKLQENLAKELRADIPNLPKRIPGVGSAVPTTKADLLARQREVASQLGGGDGIRSVLLGVFADLLSNLEKAKANGWHAAVEKYISFLQSGFNVADAVRHEAGYVLQSLVLRGATTPQEYKNGLRQEDYWSNRLTRWPAAHSGTLLSRLSNVLPELHLQLKDAGGVNTVQDAWASAVERMWPDDGTGRFQPDAVPAPLAVSISTTPQADADGDGVDDYTERYNGVAVIIKRDAGRWAHANLARLKVGVAATDFPAAVRPFLPVAVDGRTQLEIPYHGYPLGSPAFSDTDLADPTSVGEDPHGGFYDIEDVDFSGDATKSYAKPPALAYGCTYRWAAFHVTKAGSLPTELQDPTTANRAWSPRPDLQEPIADEFVAKEAYRRRSAIGAITFDMQPGQPARIGKRYSEVEPLALDQPRLCITSGAFVDLFRGVAGNGELPAGVTVDFKDIRVYGGNSGELVVEVHSSPIAEYDAGAINTARVDLAGPATVEVPTPADAANTTYWLRLKVEADVGISVSCPVPSVGMDAGGPPIALPRGGRGGEPAVLLIANDDPGWSREVRSPAKIECSLSAVSYLDWEHWISNRDLLAYGLRNSRLNAGASNVLLASLVGGLDNTGTISRLVQQLPDPAVVGYLVELIAVDDVHAKERASHKPITKTLRIGDKLATDFSSAVDRNESGERLIAALVTALKNLARSNRTQFHVSVGPSLDLKGPGDNGVFSVTVPEGVVARLAVRPLVSESSVAKSGEEEKGGAAGAVHSGLRQWAIGKCPIDGHDTLVFEGAELLIEAAIKAPEAARGRSSSDDYNALLEAVAVRPGGPSRRYDLTLANAFFEKPWGPLFSQMDVHTQRWRFSGRPVYRSYLPPHDGVSSVVWIDDPKSTSGSNPSGQTLWKPFEEELFFDRDHTDCDTRRARIGVGGDVLQTLRWDDPSATWFRHAFTFISRYRGLLVPGANGDRLAPSRDVLRWSRRAAVLADPARLTLTRPQVRCHVPLSASPNAPWRAGETPPVACVLEERPFAVGGLAERMFAEVALKPGYAFLKHASDSKPGPLDLGREIGRDPRLEAWSWMPHRDPNNPDEIVDDPTARLVIRLEGPVGLHFEQPTSPAPAWPNCQYLLQPASLDERVVVPDESFVGIRMRRALHPAWVAGNAWPDGTSAATSKPFPRQASRWLEWVAEDLRSECFLLSLPRISTDGTPHGICHYQPAVGKAHAVFRMDRNLIDPEGGQGRVVLCEVPGGVFERFALLHSGMGDGRHVLSVIGIPKESDTRAGRSAMPIVLASVVWTTPKETEETEITVGGEPSTQHPLLASEPTFMEWARTARDAATLHVVCDDRTEEDKQHETVGLRGINEVTRPFSAVRTTRPIAATDLCATLTNGRLSFRDRRSGTPCWVAPSLAMSPQSLGFQRHLVGLFTSLSAEPGRRFERFLTARRLAGTKPEIPCDCATATALRIVECEIPAAVVGGGSDSEASRLPLSINRKEPDSLKLQFGTYRLHIRFVNSPASLSAAVMVKATVLWHCNGKKYEAEFTHEGGPIRSLDVIWKLLPNSPALDNPRGRWRVAKGQEEVPEKLVDSNWRSINAQEALAGISVQIACGDGQEVWADASVLHSRDHTSEDLDAFDFGWLFTAPGEGDEDPVQRLATGTLESLTDAQLRIVAVTSPVPIRNE